MIKKYSLFISWIIACIATIGSLLFSMLYHHAPCTLCWYQRVIMFPLAIILGIAAFRKAYKIVSYVLPLALIGLCLSAYHFVSSIFLQMHLLCKECTVKGVSSPLLFPSLSLLAFLLLNASLFYSYFTHKRSSKL